MFDIFRCLVAILLFLLAPLSSATVTISNNYYIDNNDMSEEMYLDNVGYDNNVDIYSDSITGVGGAFSSDNKIGELTARLNYPNSNTGAYLHAKGPVIGGTKSFDIGSNHASMGLSYGIKNGESDAAAYNSHTVARHTLEMDGCEYSGSISAQPSSISLSGNGHRLDNDPVQGGLSQDLYLLHNGKSANIELTAGEITDLGNPLQFEWHNYISGYYGQRASSSVDFFVHHSDREARFRMAGTGAISEIIDGLIEPGVEGTTANEHWWMRYTLS